MANFTTMPAVSALFSFCVNTFRLKFLYDTQKLTALLEYPNLCKFQVLDYFYDEIYIMTKIKANPHM